MSQYNIGPRIGIEGEAQFRAQISRINSEYRSMDSYLKAVEKSMEKQGVTQDLLAQKSNAIQRQIALQNKAYAEYSTMLEKIKGLEGDHSDEITRYEGALLHTKNTLNELKFELSATEQAMADLASGVSEIAAATASAESRISEYRQEVSRLNNEFDAAKSYTDAVGRNMATTGRSMEGLANQANGLYRQIDLQQEIFVALQSELREASGLYGDNSAEVLRLSASIENVKYTVSGLERELSKTEKAMDDVAHGIEDVGDSADSAEPKVLSFGDMLKAGIASGAILNGLERAGEMIVEIGSRAIEAAADVKAANAQFSQTFGDLEGRATSALKSISDETGVAVTRLQGGYTALYAFTKSVGGDQETALNIAQRALTAAADSAAYYDRSMEDATETLQSFLKGNYENDAALGIAATETTRNAKANELYAKSFKDLTEAQKVDTLLAMVEAGNQASGALGQAAREADSWANVTGELNEAWRQLLASLGGPILTGLTPLLQGITEGLKGMTEAAQFTQLNSGIEQFRDGIAAADAALSSSNGNIEATARLAEQYIKRLQELEAAGLNTAASQREYKQVVELLSSLYPGLNLEIDKNTGFLKQNTSELALNVAAMKEQARQQAQQAYFAAIVEELTRVEKERYATEMRLYELEAQQAELLRQGAQAVDLYAATEAEAAGRGAEFWAQLSEQDRALYDVTLEIQNTKGALDELDAELATHEKKLDNATQAYGRMEEAARLAGYQTAEGLAEGIRNGGYLVEGAMKDVGKKAQVAYNRVMMIQSPSRLMMQSGGYTVAGIVEGITRNARDVENAMSNLARSGNEAYLQQQLDAVAQYPSLMAGTPGYGAAGATTNTRNVAYGGISININTQPGQDAHSIAEVVLEELTVRLGREEVIW